MPYVYIVFTTGRPFMSAFYPSLTLWVKLCDIKGLPVVKTIYTYGFQDLFLNLNIGNNLIKIID
jgi:hypothetical protein